MMLFPKDMSDTLGSGSESVTDDFGAPSPEQWAQYDRAGSNDSSSPEHETEPEREVDEAEPAREQERPAERRQVEPGAKGDEDPEIELPDGSKMKLSEINALRAGKTPEQPAATEAQRVAQEMAKLETERRNFQRQQQEHRKYLEEVIKDPAKIRELQQRAGMAPNEPSPLSDVDKWVKYRFDQYLQAGWKPEEVTREKLAADLEKAQTLATRRELVQLRQETETQKREIEERKSFDSVVKELEGLYVRPEFAYAATPEGRELVDALLAQADRDGTDVSLQDVVRKVHEHGARLIKGYVGSKQQDAKATGKLMRTGGAIRAPEPKDYGKGYDGFNAIARDRARQG